MLVSLLVLIQAVLSLVLRLELGQKILVSSLRAAVQLSLVGLVLQRVFQTQSIWVSAGVLALMISVGSYTAYSRIQNRYPGLWLDCFLSIGMNSLVVLFYGMAWGVGSSSGYSPHEVIPLAGMLVGNSLSGITISLDQFTSQLRSRKDEVESWLSHGATRWEAVQELVRESMRIGLTPILSSMSVAGIVSLPGALTGQLLAGEDPSKAVQNQILILFLLLAVTFLGSICGIILAFGRLMNRQHQLRRLERG